MSASCVNESGTDPAGTVVEGAALDDTGAAGTASRSETQLGVLDVPELNAMISVSALMERLQIDS